jgi:hypothetical protein
MPSAMLLIWKIIYRPESVVLQDKKQNRIAEVLLKEGKLQCLLDERPDCVHIGLSIRFLNSIIMRQAPRSEHGGIS